MYCERNFKTKKELKAAFDSGAELYCFQPGGFFPPKFGKVVLEGPHYPQPHKWYCKAETDSKGKIIALGK